MKKDLMWIYFINEGKNKFYSLLFICIDVCGQEKYGSWSGTFPSFRHSKSWNVTRAETVGKTGMSTLTGNPGGSFISIKSRNFWKCLNWGAITCKKKIDILYSIPILFCVGVCGCMYHKNEIIILHMMSQKHGLYLL